MYGMSIMALQVMVIAEEKKENRDQFGSETGGYATVSHAGLLNI